MIARLKLLLFFGRSEARDVAFASAACLQRTPPTSITHVYTLNATGRTVFEIFTYESFGVIAFTLFLPTAFA